MAKKLDKVDVIIVGSGWAGSIISAELAKNGHQVVCLERGEEKSVEDYLRVKDELRYGNNNELMQDLNNETITSRHKRDIPALPVRTKDKLHAGNNLGGGGNHWAAASFRFPEYDFEIYSKTVEKYGKDKIPNEMTLQDWGITYDELEKYYDRFEKMAGISGEPDPLGPERSDDYPTPPMIKTPQIKLFTEAAENLGYHPFMTPSGNLSESYENPDGERINQCQYCAFCSGFGCDFGAKSDPVVTVIPTARKTGNFEIREKSYVRRIKYEGDKATGVLYVDTKTGIEYEQPADVVVLSAYTYTNTRLLLLSEIGEPYNPNSQEGIIGKNFSGHYMVSLSATAFFEDKKFNNFMGAGALGALISDFDGDNFDHTDLDFIHGGMIEFRQDGYRPLTRNDVPEGTPNWGKEFKDKSLYYTNRTIPIRVQPSTMPWSFNYLDLDPEHKDDYGDPLLRVTNEFTDQDRNLMNFCLDKCEEIAKEMGADFVVKDKVMEEFENNFTYVHDGGGVIMGDDPKNSAVNNYSQMWTMDNLFVVGGSSFPHFPTYNPTETIGALAYRAAEGVDEYLNNSDGLLINKEKEES